MPTYLSRQGLKRIKNAIAMMGSGAKAIALIISIWVGVGTSFSFWFAWSSAIPFIASIGGMVVFFGLWLEKEVEEEKDKKEFPSRLGDMGRIKLKSEIGWWVLMVGIVIEIAVTGGLAWRDVEQAKKTALDIATKDPANQPVFDLSADAMIFCFGTNLIARHDHEICGVMGIGLSGSHYMKPGDMSKFLFLTCTKPNMVMDVVGGSVAQGAMRFEADAESRNIIPEFLDGQNAITVSNNIGFIRLTMASLPINTTAVNGYVILHINGRINKRFPIPSGYMMAVPLTLTHPLLNLSITNQPP